MDFANIIDFGADPTGVTSCNAAMAAAQSSGMTPLVPAGIFLLGDTFSFTSGATWMFAGGQFIHSDDTKPMFSTINVTGLSLLGHLRCKGRLTSEADTGESAIVFDGVNRCYVQCITAECFKGSAVKITGSSAGAFRGDVLKIDSLSVHENKRGLEIASGSGAEYVIIGSIEAVGNITAAVIGAGNTRILGGNIVDNCNGVDLIAGANHGHGGLHGVSINHNSGFNLRAVNVTNGFTIDSCHFYGDSSTAGKVILQDCAGVTISDGIISAIIEMTGTSYVNNIRDNFITGIADIIGTGLGATQRSGNYTASGSWVRNNY